MEERLQIASTEKDELRKVNDRLASKLRDINEDGQRFARVELEFKVCCIVLCTLNLFQIYGALPFVLGVEFGFNLCCPI